MKMNQSKEYYQELEQLLVNTLNEVKIHISEQDYCDVQDYIEHGEYGVGWELLWHLTQEKNLVVSGDLVICGEKMGFDI